MVNDIEKRGWKFTRRSDAVVKIRFARELAEWLPSQEELLRGCQVTEAIRLITRVESLKPITDDTDLHKKLTRAVQQFVTQSQWMVIRQHFYRYKRQHRDAVKVVAVSEPVWKELGRIKAQKV